ncbi:MAG TPA: aminotransferase class V-fold PLP-dependent enzyme [Bryobacteraceae bacterium]|nr:aminotransferase class V-fold PLP-dependent enzyme [Bryobacteraceae bacterium]
MSPEKQRARKGWKRRDIFRAASAAALAGAAANTVGAAPAAPSPDVYTRLGVLPFINATATLTINGGSRMLPEVIAAIEQAAHFHVNLEELMEKAGARIAELLGVESALVTSGTAAALTHATAGCIAGCDPEKIQSLPNLSGLKNQVIMPRESRNAYDHATRALGVELIEVDSVAELESALGPRTAMIQILGSHFGKSRFGLPEVAPLAKKAGVPILVDAAADYLILPNPYIALGADLVAYSGGKIIRGPQGAGLLIGRKDLVRAAWVNSAPHHGFGRAMKVTKEEVVGMYVAVETFVHKRDVQAEHREWESWYAHIAGRITKVPGVSAQVLGPVRGGPFPTLSVSWDASQIALTAGEVGRLFLAGEPRIMSQAAGEGHTFLIRPAALRPGEYKVIADRLSEIFRSAPKETPKAALAAPAGDVGGRWDVHVEYPSGSADHKLFLTAQKNVVTGTHIGWAFEGELKGVVDGDKVSFRSTLPASGHVLTYEFEGRVRGDTMSGELGLGDYGRARWTARRHPAA